MIQQCINENAKVALSKEEYQKRYDGLVQRFNATKTNLETVSAALNDKVIRRKTVVHFLRDLKKQNKFLQILTHFCGEAWFATLLLIILMTLELYLKMLINLLLKPHSST